MVLPFSDGETKEEEEEEERGDGGGEEGERSLPAALFRFSTAARTHSGFGLGSLSGEGEVVFVEATDWRGGGEEKERRGASSS